MIFGAGFVHGDPHPVNNMMVLTRIDSMIALTRINNEVLYVPFNSIIVYNCEVLYVTCFPVVVTMAYCSEVFRLVTLYFQ